MACGGFLCTRSMLALLNVFYIAIAIMLIGVAAYGKAVAIIATVSVLGGIIACGVFLLLIAIVGLIGAIRHHQVILFFYMIIMFLLFLVQFAVACACLALSDSQQSRLYSSGWYSAPYNLRQRAQNWFVCCGYNDTTQDDLMSQSDDDGFGHPSCANMCEQKSNATCCRPEPDHNVTTEVTDPDCPLQSCEETILSHLHQAVKIVGCLGLIFSFTELMAVWLTVRYRNRKDPRINPNTFL